MGQVGVGVAAGVAAGALAGAAVTTTYPGQIGDLDNAGRTQWTRDNTRGDPKRLERGGAVSSGMIKLLLRARRFNATWQTAKVFLLLHLPSAKGSAGPISLGSSASAISRRISPKRSSMGGSRAI